MIKNNNNTMLISLNFVSCFFFCLLIMKKTRNAIKIKNKNKNVNPTPSPTNLKSNMNSVISYNKVKNF